MHHLVFPEPGGPTISIPEPTGKPLWGSRCSCRASGLAKAPPECHWPTYWSSASRPHRCLSGFLTIGSTSASLGATQGPHHRRRPPMLRRQAQGTVARLDPMLAQEAVTMVSGTFPQPEACLKIIPPRGVVPIRLAHPRAAFRGASRPVRGTPPHSHIRGATCGPCAVE